MDLHQSMKDPPPPLPPPQGNNLPPPGNGRLHRDTAGVHDGTKLPRSRTPPRTIVALDRGSAVSSLASYSNITAFTTANANSLPYSSVPHTPAAAAAAGANKRAASDSSLLESPSQNFGSRRAMKI